VTQEIPEGTCRLNANAIVLLLMTLADLVGDKETFEMLKQKYGEPEKLAKDAETICVEDP